jgi:putative endonuclease
MRYYVYVILCKDNSYYTGYTKNLDSRMALHKNGKGARYTRMHKPKRLVHVEQFRSRAEAMRREKKIKRLSHRQKFELANSRAKSKRVQESRKPRQTSAQM